MLAPQFVNGLDIIELWKQLVSTTYKYVKVLLDSDKIKTNSGERSLLRNLGSWLGRLTIARHKPVRQRDLDIKAIIYDAYEQGKMIAILPFIGKVFSPQVFFWFVGSFEQTYGSDLLDGKCLLPSYFVVWLLILVMIIQKTICS